MQNHILCATIATKMHCRWKKHSAGVHRLSLSSRSTLQKPKIKDDLAMSHVTVPDLPDKMVASHEASEPGTLCMQAIDKGNN